MAAEEVMGEFGELVAQRIEDWRRRLIDLSFRNPLINYRPRESSTLPLLSPRLSDLIDDADPDRPRGFFFPPEPLESGEPAPERALSAPLRVAAAGEIVTGRPSGKQVDVVLRTLARRSSAEYQDKALRVLFIAAGFLEWSAPDRDGPLRSPLVLVPVELKRKSARDPFRLHFVEDEDPVVNPALTVKLERDAGLTLTESWAWEAKPILEELDDIRAAVAGTGWRVSEDAALAIFSFHKLGMYRDLLENEATIARHPLVRSLATRQSPQGEGARFHAVAGPEDLDRAAPPETVFSVLDADASQRRAIEASKRACSFVLHGPPGTGKSQTIANIIAEALAQQKRVLFISEKIAALDVVHKRLASIGLGDFCLKLRGRDAARREVVESLYASLTSTVRARPSSAEDLHALGIAIEQLNETVRQLHTSAPELCSESPRAGYAHLASLHAAPHVDGAPPATATLDSAARRELATLTELFGVLAQTWEDLTDRTFPWAGARVRKWDAGTRAHLLALSSDAGIRVRDLRTWANTTTGALGIPAPAGVSDTRDLVALGTHLLKAGEVPGRWLTELNLDELAGALNDAERTHALHTEAAAAVSERYPGTELDAFPISIDERLRAALGELRQRAGTEAIVSPTLPQQLPVLQAFIAEAPGVLDTLCEHAGRLSGGFGQPTPRTAKEVVQLCELVELGFSISDRPDPRWLVRAGLEQAERELDAIAPELTRYQQDHARLLDRYQEAIFELDLDGYIARITAAAGKRFPKLSGAHRADLKALRALARDGRLPADISGLLAELVAHRALGARIDAASERLQPALGGWFVGRETRVDAVTRALTHARTVHQLASVDSDLSRLAARVCGAEAVTSADAQLATVTHASLERWTAALAVLGPAFGEPWLAALEAQDFDSERSLLAQVDGALAEVAALVTVLSPGTSPLPSLPVLENHAELIEAARAQRARLCDREPGWDELLGKSYRGADTDWPGLTRALAWVRTLNEHLPDKLSDRLVELIDDPGRRWPDIDSLESALSELDAAGEALHGEFSSTRRTALGRLLDTDFAAYERLTSELGATIDRLAGWVDGAAAIDRLGTHGWDEFCARLVERPVATEEVVPAFERAWWSARVDVVHERRPLLDTFRGWSHGELIDRFRTLDRAQLAAATDRILAICNEHRPVPLACEGSEVGLLKHEHGKKKRHLPVRTLLGRLPTLLPALKPCLMMSPLSVSHYLTADHHFDLVVFDEASQVPPWDAINCIYRGDQLIVAGDNKQLPPMAFFAPGEDDAVEQEDEAPTTELMESVLDAAGVILPGTTLRWHYRSRHEHLIAFSNHHLYSNQLVTFPAPVSESDQLGVHLIRVPDGVYDRGRSRTNRNEALRVAERAIEHLRRRPDRTLGIVAFSVAQADAITDALEHQLAEHPDLEHHFTEDRLNGVFIKNLESVQGDERDVMIFSVGYGRDLYGKFAQAFGPLSADGGHRRLNVAITRAREQVDVISSVTAADFDLTEVAKPGARLLRAYLDFAERGPVALREEVGALGGDFESPFEATVAEAIAGLGYQAVPQVGVGGFRIDLGVIDPTRPGRFALGIECDGATYHSTPTARDRDRLRQSVLEDLGWTIHRIWSWDWVRDRPGEVERLQRSISAAIEAPRPSGGSASVVELPVRERETVNVTDLEEAKLAWVVPYRRANLLPTALRGQFHEPVCQPLLRREFETLLDLEAPVELGHAIRRIAELHGISRRGSRVVAAGREAVEALLETGRYELRGNFLWKAGQTLTQVRVPVDGDARTKRAIEEIASEEMMLALSRLRQAAGGIDESSLITQTARLLGFGATGSRIAQALRDLLHRQESAPTHVELCPHCSTKNRVVSGRVRCGRCGQEFTARTPRLRVM